MASRVSNSRKTSKEAEQEALVRFIQKALERRGITVRRENLTRGPAFKVKSGRCLYTGQKHLFVDRRLSPDQQISFLIEFLVDAPFELTEEEFDNLPKATQELISARRGEQLLGTQNEAPQAAV